MPHFDESDRLLSLSELVVLIPGGEARQPPLVFNVSTQRSRGPSVNQQRVAHFAVDDSRVECGGKVVSAPREWLQNIERALKPGQRRRAIAEIQEPDAD